MAFLPGDRVISDRHGRGTVVGPSEKVKDGVRVYYNAHLYDCIYNGYTGQRLPLCGNDTIKHEEDVK